LRFTLKKTANKIFLNNLFIEKMKNIKLFAALFAAILMTIPTFAQRGDKAHKGFRGQGMMHVLDLTPEQEAKAKSIAEAYRPKFEDLRNQEADRAIVREKMKQLRAEQETEFKKILTTDQVAKLDTHKAERKAQKEAFKEKVKNVDKSTMKDEMKTYKDKNIKPILLEQRKKLEPQISASDQVEIKELRIAMKAAKKEIKAVKDKYKGTSDGMPKGSRKDRAAHSEIQSIKDKYAEKYEAAQALADKYDTQIMALYNEIESERTQWEEDMKGIKDEYFGDIREEFGKYRHKGKDGEKAGRKGKGDHEGRGHKGRRGHHKGDKDKVAFLLMDVNKADKKAKRKGKRAQGIKVFPNPSATTNTLQYTVNQAGNVRIELHDRSGNVVRTITDSYKTSGDYTETINLSGLNGIVYYYVITDKEGTRSQKFMVRK